MGTGAGVVAVAAVGVVGDRAHRLDDWARDLGVNPRRRPSLADEALIKIVRDNQTVLLLWTKAVSARHTTLAATMKPLTANTQKQLDNLGGAVANPPQAGGAPSPLSAPGSAKAALDAVIQVFEEAEKSRSRETLQAVSGDFAQVLASIAASLAQSLVVLKRARKALA